MLTKSETVEYKDLLLTLRARVRGDVQHLTHGALSGADSEKRSPTHIAELGTETYEQDFSLQFVENDQKVLGEIRAALERIDHGTYGMCEKCVDEGRPKSKSNIRKTRLRAIPYARNCIECERKREEEVVYE